MRKVLVAMLLIFASSLPASEAFVEIPIAIGTSQSPARSTEFRTGLGIGWTHFPVEFYSFHFGYGALTTFSPLFWKGTKDVYTSGFEQDIEARAYLAYAFDGTTISFWPYIFIAPQMSMRLVKLSAFGMTDHAFRADFGFRAGGGLKIRFGDFDVKVDTAAGYGSSGINLQTTIMFGFGIF